MSARRLAWASHVFAGVFGAVAGALVVFFLMRGTPPVPAPAAVPAAWAPAESSSPELMRQIVREELARHESRAQDARANPAAPAAPAPTAPSADSIVSAERAQVLIGAAISRGTWTDHDASVMRTAMAALTPEQRVAVLEQFGLAVNEGRMRLDITGPPF